MKKKERNISTGESAGRRLESPALSKRSYTIYDSCDLCPLWAYIRLVCDEDLSALIVDGDPSPEVLEDAKHNIIREFSELSGNSAGQSASNSLKKIHLLKTEILGLSVAGHGAIEQDSEILQLLTALKVRIKKSDSQEQILKKIESAVKLKTLRLREEMNRYNSFAVKERGSEPTRGMFNDQLVQLSKHVSFRLTNNITLAEYAGYLKDFKNSNNRLWQQHHAAAI